MINKKTTYYILVIYLFLIFFQIPLKNIYKFDSLELLDEIVLVLLFFLYVFARLLKNKTIFNREDIFIILPIILLYILSGIYNNTVFYITIISLRDSSIYGFLFYLISKNNLQTYHINKLYFIVFIILGIELIISTFQLKAAVLENPDYLIGTFGPGGSHTMGWFLSYFIIYYIITSKNFNIKKYLKLFILIIFFVACSFRTLYVLTPFIIIISFLLTIISKNNKKKILYKYIILGIILYLLISVVIAPFIRKSEYIAKFNIKTLIRQQTIDSTGGRLNYFIYSYNYMDTHNKSLLIGIGPATFGSKTSRFFGTNILKSLTSQEIRRSQFAVSFSEIGIIGIITILILYIYHLLKFYKIKDYNRFYIFTISIILLYLSAGVSIPVFEDQYITVLVWLTILKAQNIKSISSQ